MFVPSPLRRADQIAGLHEHFFAFDVSVGALALKHETKSGHGVTVRGRHFARLDELKAEEHRMRGEFALVKTGIDQTDVPAFRLAALDADHFAGAQQRVVNLGPFPKVRLD